MAPPLRVLTPRSMVRIRKLRARFDLDEYFDLLRRKASVPPLVTWEDAPWEDRDFDRKWYPDWNELGASEPGTVRALITSPRAVSGRTYDVELRTAKEWIRDGELRLTDLIDVGRGWESVEDCVEVADEVDEVVHRSRFQRWIIGGLVLAGSATASALFGGLLWLLGTW